MIGLYLMGREFLVVKGCEYDDSSCMSLKDPNTTTDYVNALQYMTAIIPCVNV